jgi:hypothetical protein
MLLGGERNFPKSSIDRSRNQGLLLGYLFQDIRTLTTERDEKGARKL